MPVNRIDSSVGGGFTMKNLVLVDVSDIRWLELTCPKCKTSMTFDMSGESFFPEKCPCCPETWDGFKDKRFEIAFGSLKKFYAAFSDSRFGARFRVPVTSSSTTTSE
jgi:hypothetical protein